MTTTAPVIDPELDVLVAELHLALGDRLESVVLYGSAARGDYQPGTSDLNLLLVLSELTPPVLEQLSPPLARWEREGQPPVRLFTGTGLAGAADVFPIECMELKAHRRVLHGADPFADLVVHPTHLRLQCERELREKLMRLREAYVTCHDDRRRLRRLLADSYTTFAALFRGCLWLHGDAVADHDTDVVAAFCAAADLEPERFDAVRRLRAGEDDGLDEKAVFAGYHEALTDAVSRIDRFDVATEGETR